MEDIRPYRIEEDDRLRKQDEDREYLVAPDDEAPFHVPRD